MANFYFAKLKVESYIYQTARIKLQRKTARDLICFLKTFRWKWPQSRVLCTRGKLDDIVFDNNNRYILKATF